MKTYVKFLFILAIIYLPAFTATGAVDNTLVLHLTFDEGKGLELTDDSMYFNHGKIKGNPKWVDGKFGKALEFDGMGDSVEIPSSKSLEITNKITMEMWVKTGGGAEIKQAGIEKGGWEVGEYSLYPVYEGSVVIQFFDLPAACGDAAIRARGLDNNWHYLAGVWDGKEIFLYIDGELGSSGKCDGQLKTNVQSVHIGSRLAGERYLTGTVDEVRIYNRALTKDEVKKDMQSFGKVAVNPLQKLAVCWGDVKSK